MTLQEEQVAAKAETERKIIAACEGITSELESRKIPFGCIKDWGGRYSIKVQAPDEGTASVEIEVKSEHTSRSFRPKVEKIRIVVGRYNDKRHFLERKAGFAFKEIVDEVLQRFQRAADVEASRRQHAARQTLLEAQAARVNAEVGLLPSTRLRVYQSGGLLIEADNLSEDQALAVMQLIKSFPR